MSVELGVPAALHLATVTPTLVLGALLFLRRKGTPSHRWIGRSWVGLMLSTALISFWVRHDGFSWIHGLSVLIILTIINALIAIRRGNIRAHRGNMIGAYLGAIGAAIGALMPGRFLHHFFFG